MNSDKLCLLLVAICHNNLNQVRKLCEGEKLSGTFVPSPLTVALQVKVINLEIIHTLLESGMRPSSKDQEIYHTLPDIMKENLSKFIDSSLYLDSLPSNNSQETVITDEALIGLYYNNYEKGHIDLAHYFITLCPKLTLSNKESLLLNAAYLGDVKLFQTLLQDPEINPAKMNWPNPMRILRMYRHAEIVKILLKDPRINPAELENMPLKLTALNQRLEVVKLLLQDKRIDPSIEKHCVIEASLGNKTTAMSKAIALALVFNKEGWAKRAYNNYRAFELSLSYQCLETAKILLQDPLIMNILSSFYYSETPRILSQIVTLAIKEADPEALKILIDNNKITFDTLSTIYPDELKQNPIFSLKFFVAFNANQTQLDFLKKFIDYSTLPTHSLQEISWLHGFAPGVVSLQKQLCNVFKLNTAITLTPQHYFKIAELLYTTPTKAAFAQTFTNMILTEESVQPFKEKLLPLVKTFYPFIATAKNTTYPSSLLITATTLFPHVTESLAKKLFKTMQENLIPSQNGGTNLKKAFEEFVRTEAKEILYTLASQLYENRQISQTWVQALQQSSSQAKSISGTL